MSATNSSDRITLHKWCLDCHENLQPEFPNDTQPGLNDKKGVLIFPCGHMVEVTCLNEISNETPLAIIDNLLKRCWQCGPHSELKEIPAALMPIKRRVEEHHRRNPGIDLQNAVGGEMHEEIVDQHWLEGIQNRFLHENEVAGNPQEELSQESLAILGQNAGDVDILLEAGFTLHQILDQPDDKRDMMLAFADGIAQLRKAGISMDQFEELYIARGSNGIRAAGNLAKIILAGGDFDVWVKNRMEINDEIFCSLILSNGSVDAILGLGQRHGVFIQDLLGFNKEFNCDVFRHLSDLLSLLDNTGISFPELRALKIPADQKGKFFGMSCFIEKAFRECHDLGKIEAFICTYRLSSYMGLITLLHNGMISFLELISENFDPELRTLIIENANDIFWFLANAEINMKKMIELGPWWIKNAGKLLKLFWKNFSFDEFAKWDRNKLEEILKLPTDPNNSMGLSKDAYGILIGFDLNLLTLVVQYLIKYYPPKTSLLRNTSRSSFVTFISGLSPEDQQDFFSLSEKIGPLNKVFSLESSFKIARNMNSFNKRVARLALKFFDRFIPRLEM